MRSIKNWCLSLGKPYQFALLFGCIALAIGLRVWGLNFGLPYVYHPDEGLVIVKSQEMLKTWDFHPRFFHWPSLIFYLNTFVYGLYFLVGKTVGVFQSTADIPAPTILGMAVGYISMPTIWLASRILTMSLGVGSVVLTFVNGRSLTGKWGVGIFAAILVSVSPANVSNSRFVAPDTFATFFVLLAFYGIVKVFHTGKSRYYLFTGIAVGLATSSKYNAALIGLPLILAHLYHHGLAQDGWKISLKRGVKDWRLIGAGLISIVVFVLTTPYAILDWPMFWEGIQFNAMHYNSGHEGMEGNTLNWYLSYLWRVEGLFFILALLEIGRGVYSRDWSTILLAIFPIIYFASISTFVVRNNRTLLIAIPFFILLAAQFLMFVYSWLKRQTFWWRPYGIAVLLLIMAVTIAKPLQKTVASSQRQTIVDSRETARIWISDNLPQGAKIALESYAPFVDPRSFSVSYINKLTDNSLETYRADGVDYLIFSYGTYGRFFVEPEKYAQEVAAYEHMWSQLEPVQIFTDGGYEVRVYAVITPD